MSLYEGLLQNCRVQMMAAEFFVESDPYLMTDETGKEVEVVDLDPPRRRNRRTDVEPFIFRIPLSWNRKATLACPRALQVGNLLWYRAGITRNRTVTLSSALLESHGISRWTKYRSLRALENAELVTVKTTPGHTAQVTLLAVTES